MDWFSIWAIGKDGSNIEKSAQLKKTAAALKIAQSALGMVEGISALNNNETARLERKNERMAIENQVLAAQDSIIENLSYNTDQTIAYAARGNVSVSSPVLTERFKKGAAESGKDFAMIRANADIERVKSDISYARKRRANTQRAISSINQFAFDVGMAGLMFGSGGAATETAATGE